MHTVSFHHAPFFPQSGELGRKSNYRLGLGVLEGGWNAFNRDFWGLHSFGAQCRNHREFFFFSFPEPFNCFFYVENIADNYFKLMQRFQHHGECCIYSGWLVSWFMHFWQKLMFSDFFFCSSLQTKIHFIYKQAYYLSHFHAFLACNRKLYWAREWHKAATKPRT